MHPDFAALKCTRLSGTGARVLLWEEQEYYFLCTALVLAHMQIYKWTKHNHVLFDRSCIIKDWGMGGPYITHFTKLVSMGMFLRVWVHCTHRVLRSVTWCRPVSWKSGLSGLDVSGALYCKMQEFRLGTRLPTSQFNTTFLFFSSSLTILYWTYTYP